LNPIAGMRGDLDEPEVLVGAPRRVVVAVDGGHDLRLAEGVGPGDELADQGPSATRGRVARRPLPGEPRLAIGDQLATSFSQRDEPSSPVPSARRRM
jgi:hypothetical protein